MLLCLIAALHLTALAVMAATEVDLVARITFLLVWALLNFFWLTLVRRPLFAAIISLELLVALILLSQFKHAKLWMTADFIDVMIIDPDTTAFLLTAIPSLRLPIAAAATVTGLLLALAWRLDSIRTRVRTSALSCAAVPDICRCAVARLSDRSPGRLSRPELCFEIRPHRRRVNP